MNNEFKNTAEIKVTACGDDHTIYSNEVETQKLVIRVEKFCNKECVFKDDVIEYTIRIHNDCSVNIKDAEFCDDIPEGLEFIHNSLYINDDQVTPKMYGNKLTAPIEKLNPHSQTIICFKVKVQ